MDEPTDSALTNWGRWGPDDERGHGQPPHPETVLAACAAPSSGRVYNLGIELKPGAPFAGRRMSPVHLMSSDGGDYAALGRDDWGTADDYLFLASGGTTHVDALSHVWSGGTLYNGFDFREVRCRGAGALRHREDGRPRRPARCSSTSPARPDDASVTGADIDAYLAERDLEAQPGDAMLFRTGWMEAALAGEARRPLVPGRRPGRRARGSPSTTSPSWAPTTRPSRRPARAACCRRCTAC